MLELYVLGIWLSGGTAKDSEVLFPARLLQGNILCVTAVAWDPSLIEIVAVLECRLGMVLVRAFRRHACSQQLAGLPML